jgi:hypothetical protein
VTVSSWTSNPYPRPRSDRGDAGLPPDSGGALIAAPPPRTYLWQLFLGEGPGQGMTRVMSRRLVGPVIVKRLEGEWNLQTDVGDDFPFISIYWVNAPLAIGSNLPKAAPIGANHIYDTTFQRETLQQQKPDWPAMALGSGKTVITRYEQTLNFLITAPELYLGFDFVNEHNTGGSDLGGSLLVYEAVDPSWFGALLG